MKALITGSGGQLGQALVMTAPQGDRLYAPDRNALDIRDRAAIAAVIARETPDLVVNAAAYTAVDKAEGEEAEANAVNATAAHDLAAAAAAAGARFVHVSTDFVFDGTSPLPYAPDAPTAPLGAYGRSKQMGEEAVLRAHSGALILRTAWVYAAHGANFVKTMLRLMRERDEVRVVADQIGTPTHAASLARAIWALDAARARGIHHWTDAGVASWYDFAVAIQEEALAIGLLGRKVPIVPIRTADYSTPARRPAMSILDKTSCWGITGPSAHWRVELRIMLADLAQKEGKGGN